MTKKKNSRQKHQKDVLFADTSEEELSFVVQGKNCQHVARGIHLGRVKKTLKTTPNVLKCNGCSNEDLSKELPEVWLCLQCGYKGCGRSSESKHALQHFKTIHSDCHSLVLSTSSGVVWCYDCDDAVNVQASNILKQCVDFVTKMTPNNSSKTELTNGKEDISSHNLQNSVIKEESSVQKPDEVEPAQNVKNRVKIAPKDLSLSKPSIKGLRNLGNTCFFNAVMQNLNQTPLLYLEVKNTCTPSNLWEVPELDFFDNEVTIMENSENLKLSLPRQLPLTNSLLNFFDQMNAKSTVKVDIVNPSPLFGEISKKCPQFRHFQEQDSHELLRQLLDNIRQEEIKRQKKAILRNFGLENVSPEDVDDDMKKRCKAYGYYASHTIIEKVFGGLLISTVLCEECKMSSQIFEPFMDLSLPLFEEKQQENEQLTGMLDGGKQVQKSLRNKKSDIDEDTQGEYILPKPKYDPAKISKHQEKKQKQQAKREKKRNKNFKNRKTSLNESSEISNVPKPTDLANEENSKDSEDEDISPINQAKESGKPSDVITENVEIAVDQPNTHAEGEIDNKCITSMQNSELSENNDAHHLSITFNELDVKSEKESQMVPADCSQCPQNIANEVQNVSSCDVNNENVEVCFLKNESAPLETHEITLDFNSDGDKTDSKPVENAEESTTIHEQCDIVHELTNSFDKCCVSSEYSAEDRIQALSMQIKDVRIRRDSDRQEMLLNSSESADENESLRTNCTSPKSSVEDSCSVENGDNWSHAVSEQQTKEWILKSLTTLKPRHNVSSMECSINSCLSHFTKPELLTGNNKFRCENCTEIKMKRTGSKKEVVYSNASKQILIFSPPAVLTLHLKRFQQVGMSLRKVNRFVEFPLILDIAPFCSSASVILPHMTTVDDEILYSLYGIVEHSGRLSSGHYTAYVKASKKTADAIFECQVPLGQCNLEQLLQKYSGENRSFGACSKAENDEKRQWFYISDTHVKEVSEAQVLKCQAYLLFYERIK